MSLTLYEYQYFFRNSVVHKYLHYQEQVHLELETILSFMTCSQVEFGFEAIINEIIIILYTKKIKNKKVKEMQCV